MIAAVVLTTGCAGERTPTDTDPVAQTYTLPGDFCERLDYAIPSQVFGDPMPLPPEDTEGPSSVRCSQMYFGLDGGPGGMFRVIPQIFDNTGDARAGFDRTAPVSTASPFPGDHGLDVAAVRYRHLPAEAAIEVLDGNLIMEVKLGTATGALSAKLAERLPAITAQVTAQALDVLRSS